ncbi:MAG: long-chain fatty acid--CoA ligase [Anaerolineae bacterium]|nr:long-chain fatty acid--CoA ligase [Anaerolineae bacterium]
MRADDLPTYYNAIEILEHNLANRAAKEALFSPSRTLTFQQVSDEVNQVANALQKLDVRIGDVVGLLTYDTPEWVTSFFGTLKSGPSRWA